MQQDLAKTIGEAYIRALHAALLMVITPRRIYGWRQANQLDLETGAQKANISPKTLQRYERGETTPRLKLLIKLYNAMMGKPPLTKINWKELATEIRHLPPKESSH